MTGSFAIPLNQGFEAIVSPEDADVVGRYRWFVTETSPGKLYALRAYARGKTIYLHRFILGARRGQMVDHINGNGLDNRRCNLRFATPSQNLINRIYKNQTGFRGVHSNASGTRFRALVECQGIVRRSSYLDSAEQAAREYDNMARDLHGEFAILNFPEGR